MPNNQSLPTCSFLTTSGLETTLQKYQGHWIVLYFYPKDATPGCTLEGQQFRDQHNAFLAKHAVILGVSRDTLRSHETFKEKHCFPFELISDKEERLCHHFDVIKEKSMYGKLVRGIERSTFLIDPKGVVRHEWRKVRAEGHAAEVLETLTQLQKTP